jgi:hypothetical protein
MLNKMYLDLQKVRHARRSFLPGQFTNKAPATLTGGEQHKRTLLPGRYG